jgi:4-alpha-glucanotransferase
MERNSGILMHITSLPGKYGIGTLGEEAYDFVDFLVKAGQKYWQVLPLAQTGYGDSPYQSCCAFSGNPYLIDFDILQEEGLLEKSDYQEVNFGESEIEVNFEMLFNQKQNILRIAYENSKGDYNEEIREFKIEQKYWIDDYSLYMAIKSYLGNLELKKWDFKLKIKDKIEIEKYKELLKDEIEYWVFVQYLFFKQWKNLKEYANYKGIEIIGDIPIYVAEDSSDLWAKPEYFKVDSEMNLEVVAGCPPDKFSKTGQLWGNPIYNWEEHLKDDYKWWKKRIEASLNLFDIVRIDHFRGFEAYYEVVSGAKTAEKGCWVKGPGISLFNSIKKELGEVKIIAEDLGYITEEVIELRERTGFPGMKVLQFGFDQEEKNQYLPHTYPFECVAYTGTHDNDTALGWIEESGSKQEVEFSKKYLKLTEKEGYSYGFIRGIWASTANISIALMQDFLECGSECRMNLPSELGWWRWRVEGEKVNDKLAKRIYDITKLYDRLNAE